MGISRKNKLGDQELESKAILTFILDIIILITFKSGNVPTNLTLATVLELKNSGAFLVVNLVILVIYEIIFGYCLKIRHILDIKESELVRDC